MFKTLPNIKPAEQTIFGSRKIFREPFVPTNAFLLGFFTYVFFAEHMFPLHSSFERLALIIVWVMGTYAAMYWFVGRPINFLVSRNVSVVLSLYLFCSLASYVQGAFAWYVKWPDQTYADFLWHGFSLQMVFIPPTIVCVLFYEKRLRKIFGHDPENVPIWFSVNRNADQILSLLPRRYRGKLLKLQAARQYVEVTTDKGTVELRATLKSLLELLPENDGVHLHRSTWIRNDQLKEFSYKNGNPVVTDIHGTVIPVGRSRVEATKKALNQAL
ncbi:MAG: LytTR family DNA-binding domain-containing protein [Pseudomonadota bacterium]